LIEVLRAFYLRQSPITQHAEIVVFDEDVFLTKSYV